LEELKAPSLNPPIVETKVIDSAAFVNINAPKESKTFGEYCSIEIADKIRRLSCSLKRLDFVFDTYREVSIKSQTREDRGKGFRVSVREETPICKRFSEFLRNNDNKTELFKMLAGYIVKVSTTDVTIIATSAEHVLSNSNSCVATLEPCNHEEADTRLLLHVLDASKNDNRKITTVTVDTDVVIIALYHFFSLNLQ
jgi:hypothetical protein